MRSRVAAFPVVFSLLVSASCYSGHELPGQPTPTASPAPTGSPTRADIIVQVITSDDLALIHERPLLVAEKYAKMASDPFLFVRGSLPLFNHDLAAHPELASQLPAATALLQNDPHPENLGTLGMDAASTADWNDFDGASVGPTGHDVLRGAVALAVFMREATNGGDSRPYVQSFLDAYASATPGDGGAIVAHLLSKAATDGAARQEIADDVVLGTTRTLVRSSTRIDVDPQVRSDLQASLPAYASTRVAGAPALPAFADVVEILGKGVSSLPRHRYEILLTGAASDGSDDVLLQMKEAWDGVAGVSTSAAAFSFVNGMRTDDAAPDLDPNLGVSHAGSLWLVTTTVTAWNKGVDESKTASNVGDGTWTSQDLLDLSQYLGGELALAHQRGGAASLALDSGSLADTAEAWADIAFSDHDLFAARLASDGPTFGVQ